MPKDYLSPDTTHLIDVLRDLIGFSTVAPPGSFYNEIIDYLIPIFKDMEFKTHRIIMPKETFEAKCTDQRLVGDRVNLIAQYDAGADKTLVIYAHLDVVPAAAEDWSTDPFKLTRKEDKLYGRGVSDCKGAVAGLIAALRAILKEEKPRFNLSILLTTDEEVGGYSGLCFLADQGLIKGDCMLCMDGFSDDLVIGSNGIITWDITVRGRSAHSGSSFLGVNAIENSIPVMEALMTLKKDIQSRRSNLEASSAFQSLGIKNLMPMLNITMINGGIKENIVPASCNIRGDRRVMPEESMDEAMAEIERNVSPFSQNLDLKFFPGYPPMYVNPNHPWVTEVRNTIERITGFTPKLSGAQGSLDQAYATDMTKIPTCVYGVGRQLESNIHGADENVRLADLESFSRFLIALMK